MSKSPLAIAGIGLGGCILLASMLKQAVRQQQAEREAPRAAALASRFAARLDGPLAIREEMVGDAVRIAVHGRAAAAEDRRELAADLGAAVWLTYAESELPFEVRVTLRDARGGEPVSLTVPRPAAPASR